MRQVFFLFALFLCLGFANSASASYSVTVNAPDFAVSVGFIPDGIQWTYYANDNTSTVYSVTFVGLWEIENGTKYDLVENSYVKATTVPWNFTMGELVNNSQTILVSTQSGLLDRFDSIALKTHIPMGAVNGSDYPAGKFDVDIKNYKWLSLSDSAQLVLVYKLDYQVDSKTPMMPNLTTHGSRTIDFSGAYFSINSTAMGGPTTNTSITVAVKMADTTNSTQIPANFLFNLHNAYVVYDRFDTNLHHDPEFGFGEGPGNSYIWIIIIVVVVIAIIVIILIAVIGFILVRRRRRSYDAF
jgi:hypothetical protein